MKAIAFKWNSFYCICHYNIFSKKVAVLLSQPMELLGKGFAVIEKEIPIGGTLCAHDLVIKEGGCDTYLSRDGATIILSASGENLLKTEIIACLLLQIFLVEGLKQGILSFHGSAIHICGKNILLLGESGAGKTTVAFELCTRKGGQLIGNDFLALKWQEDRLEILWDDRASKMSLRKDVASAYSDQEHYTDQFLGSENRNYYNPEHLNIQIYESKGFVDEILWIELSETEENLIRTLDFQENMKRLYVNSMGLITGTHLKLYDHQGNWVCNCPHLLETKKLIDVYGYLTKVICHYGCKEVRGDLPFTLTVLCSQEGGEATG